MPCKPEQLVAIVSDTRRLMDGINKLTRFLVEQVLRACNVRHAACDRRRPHPPATRHACTRAHTRSAATCSARRCFAWLYWRKAKRPSRHRGAVALRLGFGFPGEDRRGRSPCPLQSAEPEAAGYYEYVFELMDTVSAGESAVRHPKPPVVRTR